MTKRIRYTLALALLCLFSILSPAQTGISIKPKISTLGDTTITSPADGNFLSFVAGLNKWVNGPAGCSTNPQSGASYTVLSTDRNKCIKLTNAGAVAVTVPQPSSTFTDGFVFRLCAQAGGATLTPTSSTINAAASLPLAANTCAWLHSDGTNWDALVGSQGGSAVRLISYSAWGQTIAAGSTRFLNNLGLTLTTADPGIVLNYGNPVTLSNIICYSNPANGAGAAFAVTFTFYKAGSPSAVSCSIQGNGTLQSCSPTGTTSLTANGTSDTVSVQMVAGSSTGSVPGSCQARVQ